MTFSLPITCPINSTQGRKTVIIRRYLTRQLLTTTFAVTALLTLILMGGRVIKYFGMAAEGRLDVELLSAVLLYRLPGFLELIIPLGLFIAVLLVFGRLYIDNEISVMASSGMSRWQLVAFSLPSILLVTLCVAGFSFYLTPHGNLASEKLFNQQANRNTFDMVRAGQFQHVDNNMLYARALSADKTQLLDVTLYNEKARPDGTVQHTLLYAKTARRFFDEKTALTYIELAEGYRYELTAGQLSYNQLRFQSYRMRLTLNVDEKEISRTRTMTTATIYQRLKEGDLLALGEWLWRCSMPLIAPIAALLALPLAKVNPRQGRYLKLLPAILLYISFVVFIGATRNSIEKGKLIPIALWAVHLSYLVLALLLLSWDGLMLRYRAWRQSRQAQGEAV
ncbi:MAG: LPS export ABC transporter permease LptF [Moraxellaceae bacterium]|nr:LPS export ABC transporter permease LptF [Moraxellaceae bacterium]